MMRIFKLFITATHKRFFIKRFFVVVMHKLYNAISHPFSPIVLFLPNLSKANLAVNMRGNSLIVIVTKMR